MSGYYLVCTNCGHIEPTTYSDDRPFRCENCGENGCESYVELEEAEDASEHIIENEGRL